jgi:hypothetical protein
LRKRGSRPDEAHQLLRHVGPVVGVADLVDHERLAQDVEHRHPRAEGAERVLENILDSPPEAHQRLRVGTDDVDHRAAIVEQHLAAVGLERAHDHLGQRRLAAAALADESEALAARDGEAHVVDCPEHRPLALAEKAAAALLERFADVTHVEVEWSEHRRAKAPSAAPARWHRVRWDARDEALAGLHVEMGDGMQERLEIGWAGRSNSAAMGPCSITRPS